MMNKVALVTGSNQGLGFALVETLCKNLGPNSSVYLTARNGIRGEEAVRQPRDRGLSPTFHLIDVTDDKSIAVLEAPMESLPNIEKFSLGSEDTRNGACGERLD
jgi:NAD(P)-dependent dehydrogenase (short-subunit alcohol dehydrogenase family)